MEANELRLGNYIDKYGKPTKVDLGILQKIENGSVIYKPITLTEEWLLKLDFTKDENEFFKWGFYLENRANDTYSKGIFKEDFGAWINNTYLREIKYVHQLQNLLHAIVGDKLTITD